MIRIKKVLTNPDDELRPWAIWNWNLKITADQAVTQLNDFKERGFCGVAIRPSRDMQPGFLSEEFFQLFQLVLETASKEKILVKIADDVSVPLNSFFANQLVMNKDYRLQQMVLESTEFVENQSLYQKKIDNFLEIIVFLIPVKHNNNIEYSHAKLIKPNIKDHVISLKVPDGKWQIAIFKKTYLIDPWGCFVPNIYNQKVTQLYISMVLQTLKTRFSRYIPKTLCGFITELPSAIPSENSIPWDNGLATQYRAKFKKNLIEILPLLLRRTEAADSKEKCDALAFLYEQMYERYAMPLELWGKKNKFSQWLLIPERSQYRRSAGLRECIIFPEGTFGAVGMQNLGGVAETYPLLKSIADNNGVQKCQNLVVIGRNNQGKSLSLQQLRSEIDNVFSLGPSVLLIDGFFFNIDRRNYVKTPFNPSWYSLAWSSIKELCEYSARLTALSRIISQTPQVAVLMPAYTMLSDFALGNDTAMKNNMLILDTTIKELQRLNIDYELIGEKEALTASVCKTGEISITKGRKRIFKALIVPQLHLISKKLYNQLQAIISKQGKVVFIAETASASVNDNTPNLPDIMVEKLTKSKKQAACIVAACDLGETLKDKDITASAEVFSGGKKCSDIRLASGVSGRTHVYFIHNISEKQEYFVSLEIPHNRYFFLLDCSCVSLKQFEEAEPNKAQKASLNIMLMPQESVIVVGSAEKPAGLIDRKCPRIPTNFSPRNYRVVLKDQWSFTPLSLNVLPLAHWNSRIGLSRESGGYSHFYECYFEVRNLPEICLFNYNDTFGIAGERNFDSKVEIAINGTQLDRSMAINKDIATAEAKLLTDMLDNTPYVKRDSLYNIKDIIKKGFNRVSIRTIAPFSDPLSIVYPPLVMGSFGLVKGSQGWIIDNYITEAGSVSWTKSGYPFMSGRGSYKQVFETPSNFNKLILRFSQVSGSISVSINGQQMGRFNWQPIAIELSDLGKSKRNELEFCIDNTVDNVLRLNGRPSGLTGEVYLDVC